MGSDCKPDTPGNGRFRLSCGTLRQGLLSIRIAVLAAPIFSLVVLRKPP